MREGQRVQGAELAVAERDAEIKHLREALRESQEQRRLLASQLQAAHEQVARVEEEGLARTQAEVERSEAKLKRELEFIRRGSEAAAAERDRALSQARALQERAVAWAVGEATARNRFEEQARTKTAQEAHEAALSQIREGLGSELDGLRSELEGLRRSSESLANEVLRVARHSEWPSPQMPHEHESSWDVAAARQYLESVSFVPSEGAGDDGVRGVDT